MDGLDLKAYLDAQTREGTMDSEGSFTVAREKALRKLASFALPGEYDWVLKIVQAANAWKAEKLVVCQTRVATSLFFCPTPGLQFPTESAVVEALNSPVLDKDNPMHQLAMALRSLVQQARLSFVMAVRHRGDLCKPIYAGHDVSRLDPTTREQWTNLKLEGVRLTVSHFTGDESITGRYLPTFSRQVRRDLSILETLERRCFASPTPILVDGRLITRVYPRGELFTTHKRRPLLVGKLTEEGVQLDPVPGQLPQRYLTVSASHESAQNPWLVVIGPDWKMSHTGYKVAARLLTPVSQSDERPGHDLWWVRQGVAVACYRIPAEVPQVMRLSLFFSADQHRTDLSGLQIELEPQPPEAAQALQAVHQAVLRTLSFQALRDGLLTPPEPELGHPGYRAPEETLEQVGESATTASLGFELPSPGLGLLQLVHRTEAMLTRLPEHGRRLEDWARQCQEALGGLADDLEEGPRYLTRTAVF